MPPLSQLVLRGVYLDRLVYATITLMSVLIIYDGWQHLQLRDVVGVIVGPVVAMFMANVFSALIARQVELERPLRRSDLWKTIRSESHFLLLCVPPLVIVLVLFGFGVSLSQAIHVAALSESDLWILGLCGGETGWLYGLADRGVIGAGLSNRHCGSGDPSDPATRQGCLGWRAVKETPTPESWPSAPRTPPR